MNLKTIFFLILGIAAAKAVPVITADKKYSPPSDWTVNKDFQKESWWSAFYSMERPENFEFSEWKTHYPEHFLREANITKDKFPTLVAAEVEKRKKHPRETKIYRVVSIADGAAEYVAIVQCVMTSKNPREGDAHVTSCFKKNAGTWVVAEFSRDLSEDPIAKLLAEE